MKKHRKSKPKKHQPRAAIAPSRARPIASKSKTPHHAARTAPAEPAWSFNWRDRLPSALAATYSADDRETIALLSLPLMLIASAILITSTHRGATPLGSVATHVPAIEAARPVPPAPTAAEIQRTAVAARPAEPLAPVAAGRSPEIADHPLPQALLPEAPAPQPASAPVAETLAAAPSAVTSDVASGGSLTASAPPAAAVESSPSPALAPVPPGALAETPSSEKAEPGRVEVAALTPTDPALVPHPPVTEVAPPAPEQNFCPAGASANMKPRPVLGSLVPPSNPDAFGLALAAAAREQLDDFVIYTDKYYNISYPMGDLPILYGVCTDVIVRAFRAVGYDLQQLVQETHSGAGDKNIDHRRVDTLRKFFAKYGDDLPITEFAEDYKPGDIVSYYRPQNRHSRTHIAIVSDEIGPSGRPMIIHNRGWGPQQEDALFVDQITGHYRFTGAKLPLPAATPTVAGPKIPGAKPAGSAMVRASYGGSGALSKSKVSAR